MVWWRGGLESCSLWRCADLLSRLGELGLTSSPAPGSALLFLRPYGRPWHDWLSPDGTARDIRRKTRQNQVIPGGGTPRRLSGAMSEVWRIQRLGPTTPLTRTRRSAYTRESH